MQKSDTQLQLDVLAELKWEPSINAAQIGVEVRDGIVTLAGHVNTYAEKWDAGRATQRVPGVKALAVEMDVKLEGSNNRTDADIARSAENVLQWTTYLLKDAVKIKVEKGWVTLTGEVEWQYQRQAAAAAIRYLMGVSGVSDQITIKTKVSAPVIKTDIEAALKRRALQDAHEISVSVHGTDVTLTGKVHSWSERELARNTAWGTPGVRNTQKPVSRQQALNCLHYYTGLGYHESDAEYQRLRTTAVSESNRASGRPIDDDPHLRSTGDVMACRLDAADGDIGRVLGLLVDEKSWAIRFMIVDTSAWWDGHQVLIAPESIDDVHWKDSHVVVDLKRQSVKESPPYDVHAPFDNEQGESTYRHYGLEGYRSMETSVC